MMTINIIKKSIILLLSILLIPISIGVVFGGGYIAISLLRGIPFNESISQLTYFSEVIQPYFKYVMIVSLVPLAIKLLKSNRKKREL